MWNNNTLEDELQRNILEYGVSVNTDRAIPDAKSGLKPVARRILWDAFTEGRTNNKPHVKSARIVGDTMGRFHPHGDSSIYGALVRLSQDWVMRYPLIDLHGSNGNIFGDDAAAMRYTESRLSKIAEDGLLAGIKKNTVKFIPNYDETEEEPVTLPAIFPNLLCNPNEGIGWAIGCKWAPHNLNEVAAAIKDYLAGKEPMLPGPDFPTGGVIINKDDIPNIMKTGSGTVKIRGKYTIEKQNIVFTELPYNTRLEALMAEIGTACDNEKIKNISDIRNESSKKGLRLVIQIDKGINPETVVNQLFLKTNLQTTFSYNQVALIDKVPTELNLKQAIKVYVNHNIECITKEARYDEEKALARLEIVKGLLKALADIDNIIVLIKKSESAAAAKQSLIAKYNFTDNQAQAILDMKLSRLARLEGVELNNEKADLEKKIEELDWLINHEEAQQKELIKRLDSIVKKYGDARRTELAQIEVPKEEKEIVEVIPEDVVVVTSQSGLIKRIPVTSFKTQKRNGVGIKSNDDITMDVCKTNTIDYIMFFTNTGKMYRTIVDNIPSSTNATKGTPISTLIKMEPTEKVVAVSSLHRKILPKYAIFITKKGNIKKTYLEEYMKTNRNSGINAIKLAEGDSVVNVIFMDEEEIVMITKKGMSIRFDSKEISAAGKTTMGVKGIKLKTDDEVVTGLPIHKLTDNITIISTIGIGKQIKLDEFTKQGRGGVGVMIFKDMEVAGAAMTDQTDSILVCGNRSSIAVKTSDIPIMGRTASGVQVIKNNKVLSITKI